MQLSFGHNPWYCKKQWTNEVDANIIVIEIWLWIPKRPLHCDNRNSRSFFKTLWISLYLHPTSFRFLFNFFLNKPLRIVRNQQILTQHLLCYQNKVPKRVLYSFTTHTRVNKLHPKRALSFPLGKIPIHQRKT